MIYVIHFTVPLGTVGRNSARHYVGFCADRKLRERLEAHRQGRGARITAAAVRAGAELVLVARLPGDRAAERKRKRAGHYDRLCPLCVPKKPGALTALTRPAKLGT
jgi:hypothetical protein